uniref:Uncharacterized protein n=1 Tax=Siphoviridae sp. ctr2f5 TaxID=2825684 RepID=A0A8S5QFT5_9CAUD|nr:MAG TPA: hypothetical protein [Siphoviridae sp. ctr2f5]
MYMIHTKNTTYSIDTLISHTVYSIYRGCVYIFSMS